MIDKKLLRDLDNRVYENWAEVFVALRATENLRRETLGMKLGFKQSSGGAYIRNVEEATVQPSPYLLAATAKYFRLGIKRILELDKQYQTNRFYDLFETKRQKIKKEYSRIQ